MPRDFRKPILSVFRKGLRALLASMPAAELAIEATSGEVAIRLADEVQPDVMLIDLQMPKGDGLAAIRQIVQTSLLPRILVITMFQDNDSVFAALKAGTRGYILKDMDDEEITRAILTIGKGEAIFSSAIAERMLKFISARPALPTSQFPELTESERNVLALMAGDVNNEEIARQLSFSSKTVRNYVSSIFSEL